MSLASINSYLFSGARMANRAAFAGLRTGLRSADAGYGILDVFTGLGPGTYAPTFFEAPMAWLTTPMRNTTFWNMGANLTARTDILATVADVGADVANRFGLGGVAARSSTVARVASGSSRFLNAMGNVARGVPVVGGLISGAFQAFKEVKGKEKAQREGKKGNSLFRSITKVVGSAIGGAAGALGATALVTAGIVSAPVAILGGLALGIACPTVGNAIGDIVGKVGEMITGYDSNEIVYINQQNTNIYGQGYGGYGYGMPQMDMNMPMTYGMGIDPIMQQANAIFNSPSQPMYA